MGSIGLGERCTNMGKCARILLDSQEVMARRGNIGPSNTYSSCPLKRGIFLSSGAKYCLKTFFPVFILFDCIEGE